MNDGGEGWDLSSDTLKLSTVRFDIKPSTDAVYHVTLKKYSFGSTEEEASNRANRIQYTVFSRDSVLDLGNGYAIGKENKFRGQQVEIEILVPVGKKIRFDESVDDKLNSVNVKINRVYHHKRVVGLEFNRDDRPYHYRPGIDYVMAVNGELKDPNGTSEPASNNNDYHYPVTDSSTKNNKQKDIQQKIDSITKEKEREIKQLEEKNKVGQIPSTTYKSKNYNPNKQGFIAAGPSVYSMTEWF
jgi:hypothetical protein